MSARRDLLTDEEQRRLDAPLDEALEAFRATYEAMFGAVPPLPDAKLQVLGRLDPQAARLSEELRAHAFLGEVLGPRMTQLMLFGMLLVQGAPAARHHAEAALRAGATVTEVTKVVELASAVASLGPINQGAAMLKDLVADR